MSLDENDSGVLSSVIKSLPIYAVYVFVAGWTFYDYYFRYFGVNPRWLEIAFHDTLTKGFTILFEVSGWKLWVVYALMLAVPLVAESLRSLQNHSSIRRVLEMALVATLVGLFPLIYWISREAGINQAKADKGSGSSLPIISFTANKRPYKGHLLFLKSGTYFVHNVDERVESEVQEVSIFRAEEVTDVRVVEFK